MNDRELLEMAAKAAGIGDYHVNGDGLWICPEYTWNPLTNDGDALRLAVKLNMNICVSSTECIATIGSGINETVQAFDGSATRRAITRAAAAIGAAL